MKLDIIKKCLSVDSIEETNMLFEDIAQKIKVMNSNKRMITDGVDSPELEPEADDQTYYYDSDLVITILEEFIGKKDQRKTLLSHYSINKLMTLYYIRY